MGSDHRNPFSGKSNLTTDLLMAHFHRITFLLIVSMCFVMFLQLSVAASTIADDWDDWDEEEEDHCFTGMCLHYSFLEIRDVAFEPTEADRSCHVSVEFAIAGFPERDSRDIAKSKLESATIHYVVNDDFQNRRRSEMKCADMVCRADIPGFPEGTQITFVISATNAFGHMTTELFRADTPQNLHNALIAMPHKDDFGEFHPDDLDVLHSVAAFDDGRLYMGYSVQGAISPGSDAPPSMNMYGIAFRTIDDENELTMFNAFSGIFWIYFPGMTEGESQGLNLINTDGWQEEAIKEIDNFRRTGHIVVDMDKIMQKQVQQSVLTHADERVEMCDGGTFIGSVSRAMLGPEIGNPVRISIMTASNDSKELFTPIPYDSPTYMYAYLRNHKYSVGADPEK
jgi:hypothetical protein